MVTLPIAMDALLIAIPGGVLLDLDEEREHARLRMRSTYESQAMSAPSRARAAARSSLGSPASRLHLGALPPEES